MTHLRAGILFDCSFVSVFLTKKYVKCLSGTNTYTKKRKKKITKKRKMKKEIDIFPEPSKLTPES